MGTIATKLEYLNTTKEKIRDSINLTGANIGTSDTFRSYANKLKKGYIDIINNGIDTLYNNFPKVSGIGSNLSLTPTYEAPMKLNEIQGDTLQENTPTPDTPVEIQNVTGLQNIEVCGKNLLDLSKCINGYINSSGGIGESNYDLLSDYIKVESGKNYTISLNTQFNNIGYAFYDSSKTYILRYNTNRNLTTLTTTIPSGTSYIRVWFNYNGTTNLTPTNILQYEPMVENNSTATEYEPYKGNTYEVNLGKNLCNNALFVAGSGATINSYTDNSISVTFVGTYKAATQFIDISNSVYTFSIGNISNDKGRMEVYLYNNGEQVGTKQNVTANQTYTIDNTSGLGDQIRLTLSNSDLTQTNEIIFNNIQLEKGTQSTSFSPYFTPIELNKIGTYQDSIKKSTGKNLFDKDNTSSINAYINDSTSKFTSSGTVKTYYIPCKGNTTYTLSKILSNQFRVGTSVNIPAIDGDLLQVWKDNSATTYSITTNSSAKYLCFCIHNSSGATVTEQQVLDSLMINEGSTALPYEPYGKVWYIEKQIGKVVLNGSNEGWGLVSTYTNNTRFVSSTLILSKTTNLMSNYFVEGQGGTDTPNIDTNGTTGQLMITIPTSIASTHSQFITWLSTNKPEILYQLDTPEYTEITNTELIEDLETLYTAKSQDGTTNISITSEDLEMILNVSALKGDA